MSYRSLLVPIRVSSSTYSSIHKNVSRGYYIINKSGEKTFVPYNKNEVGEIHSFISPQKMRYKHMKWTKTKKWKNKEKAKNSKWICHSVFNGLNTVSK